MKFIKLFLTSFFLLLISCSSQTDTNQSLLEEVLSTFVQITNVVESINDKESADSAKLQLEQLGDKIIIITNKIKKNNKIDDFMKESDYNNRFKSVLSQLYESSSLLSDKPYGTEIMDKLINILNLNSK